jgi:SAM-dependent methyltransferase
MEAELAGYTGATPERFVPGEMRGGLIEVEHLSRYWWAAGLAAGRRVLDAGCGVGYGTAILSQAGATEAIGVDIAESIVEAARGYERPGTRFEQGDISDLDFPQGHFDLVVCLEVIEHMEDPRAVTAELARVLAEDGVLVISSPNRDRYVEGNPHHVKEFTPEELRELLTEFLPNLRLYQQHEWIASAVLDEDDAAVGDGNRMEGVEVRKVESRGPGSETYTLALASRSDPPSIPAVATLGDTVEVRRWLESYEAQQHVLAEQRDFIHEMAAIGQERNVLARRLIEAENRIAYLSTLEGELGARDETLRALRSSRSWRLTAPLRRIGAAARRLRGGGG